MKLSLILVGSLLAFNILAMATNQILTPGVTMTRTEPQNWSVDLRGTSESEAHTVMECVSQRLYGLGDRNLHRPLEFSTDYKDARYFGFHIKAVSQAGATLKVTLDDGLSAKLTWPRASQTHLVDGSYYFPLDAGAHSIRLEIVEGDVVRIKSYFIADKVEDIPAPAKALELEYPTIHSKKAEGYRGIWFALGQFSEHGDKYSGGLGTYTANHTPMAVYSEEAKKTYFVYGGTPDATQRYLLCMIGCYDHESGRVSRPTIVYDKGMDEVNDPHDNPSIAIDDSGYVWVFVSGRNQTRDGILLKSTIPYSIDAFEEVLIYDDMTYPQPWVGDGDIRLLFSKYTAGRELYYSSSSNGRSWTPAKKLVGFGGHYQVSAYNRSKNKLGTFFNYHPDGDVDRRTNLYYMQCTDGGDTWTSVEGTSLSLPLNQVQNPALVIDLKAQGLLQYTCDLNWDAQGNPMLLYVTSHHFQPGPNGDPREVRLTRWDGSAWVTSIITTCTHNYDMGSLYVNGSHWSVIFPSGQGPQRWGTGGEIEIWISEDAGNTWTLDRDVTRDSLRNHGYVRRPFSAADPFIGYWADGNPDKLSVSCLYFTNQDGTKVWRLPYNMELDWQTPVEIERSLPHR